MDNSEEFTSVEQHILMCVLADIETMATLRGDVQREHWFREYLEHGVRYQPSAWLQRGLSMAERQRYSRATLRLVGRGMLERDTEESRDRVAFVRPRPAGLTAMLDLAGDSACLEDVTASLSQTFWGDGLLQALPTPEPDTMLDVMDLEWPP